MRKVWYIIVLISILIASCNSTENPQAIEPTNGSDQLETENTTLRALFIKQGAYQDYEIQAMTKEYTDKHPNIKVEADFVSYEALHDKIVTAAVSKAGTYDIVLIDCIWPAEFAAAGFIKDVTDLVTPEIRADIWPAALEAVTYKGKLYGMPWINDVVYLYYNEELLKKAGYDNPPKTWTEVMEMSMAAKQKNIVKYPFIEYFQQDEGLTIGFTYYLAAFGGKFFDENDKPAFNSPEGKAALDFLVAGMNNGMYNPASLESTYEEVRHTYSQGDALFSVNWTYVYNLSNDPKESQIAGNSKITLVPGEVLPSVTVNGGMGLSIMDDSEHPKEAWDYILYLSSKDVQKRYSANALPIWISLFDDPDLVKSQGEFLSLSKEQYKFMVNRPIVPFYSEASKILSRELQAALIGTKTSEQALADAEAAINLVRDQYKIVP